LWKKKKNWWSENAYVCEYGCVYGNGKKLGSIVGL
jgi:hypothetical protein